MWKITIKIKLLQLTKLHLKHLNIIKREQFVKMQLSGRKILSTQLSIKKTKSMFDNNKE